MLKRLNIDIKEIEKAKGEKNKINNFKKQLKNKFTEFYEEIFKQKFAKLDVKSKLFLYKHLKQNLKFESYLKLNTFDKRNVSQN